MKEIKGHEGRYAVTEIGQVWSYIKYHSNGKFLRPGLDRDGYQLVNLYKNNKGKVAKVHRLVAEAFVPNPTQLPEVNHKNGVKTDNRVVNLEWCTGLQNQRHGRATGLIAYRQHSKLNPNQVRKIRAMKGEKSQYDLAKHFCVSQTLISQIHRNVIWLDLLANPTN